MNAKEFVEFVENEWDVEMLEMMQECIDNRLTYLKQSIDMANQVTIEGFGKG